MDNMDDCNIWSAPDTAYVPAGRCEFVGRVHVCDARARARVMCQARRAVSGAARCLPEASSPRYHATHAMLVRSEISRRLLRQNAMLKLSIESEFAAMPRAARPRFERCMASYEQALLGAAAANDAVIERVFGTPARAGPLTQATEWLGFSSDGVYDGLGSLWRHLAKDWSTEGAAGGAALRERIVGFATSEAARWPANTPLSIVVPGCGQARLAWALANALPQAQVIGIEQSAATLGLAKHILYECEGADELTVHPWLDAFPNNLAAASRVGTVSVPDALPARLSNLDLRLGAFPGEGDGGSGSQKHHVLVTNFFLDCVDDLPATCAAIHDALVPGGAWIFSGPLHYYQGGGAYSPRPAPALSHLLELAHDLGLHVEGLPELLPAPYVRRPGAFLHEADWTVPCFLARRATGRH